MKTLVFGQTGQVAIELQQQVEVIALGRDQVDLSDPAACAAAIRSVAPDVVINAAAYTAVDRAEDERALASMINGEAPGAMARACTDLGIPFVHISTDYVFDGSGDLPRCVDDPVGPINTYGRSKLAGELAVRAAGGVHAILRTSWVFSAHGANFVKTMLRLGADRDRLTIVADQIGGPTPAPDIAAACLSIATQLTTDGTKSGTYHFSGAPNVSWAGFAREIFAQQGLDCEVVDIPTVDYPAPAKRPLNSRLDCSALTEVFGITQPDWRIALTRVLAEIANRS